jgi:hypothetical protein
MTFAAETVPNPVTVAVQPPVQVPTIAEALPMLA